MLVTVTLVFDSSTSFSIPLQVIILATHVQTFKKIYHPSLSHHPETTWDNQTDIENIGRGHLKLKFAKIDNDNRIFLSNNSVVISDVCYHFQYD